MKGDRTRQSILDHAVNLASTDGLEGLTIGRLADDLEMSKSGLFAHFGSKEELQLATIEEAKQRFVDEVFRPVLKVERGYPRLLSLCRSWIDYLRRGVFPGGCFFAMGDGAVRWVSQTVSPGTLYNMATIADAVIADTE